MTKQSRIAVAAAFVLTVIGSASIAPVAQATPSQPPKATASTSITRSPAPVPGYDPGPRPISVVNLCAVNLRLHPPLYQQANAPLAIAANEVPQVVTALNTAGTPMYVSILGGPGERASGLSREIQERMNVPGTFLTIIGTVYDTFSTQFDAQPLLSQAFAEQRSNGTAAVITRFAELSGQAANGPIPTPDMIAWRPTLILFGVVFGVGVVILVLGWRKQDEDAHSDGPPPIGSVDLPESS